MAGAAERRNKMLNEHAPDYAYSEGKALMDGWPRRWFCFLLTAACEERIPPLHFIGE